MADATEQFDIIFQTSDGSFFRVVSHDASRDSITLVQWRSVDLCADCWLDQLTEDEERSLTTQMKAHVEVRRGY